MIGLVFFIWYPVPLATAVGVTHIFLIILAIDIIVGPFLGLVVYKHGKKTLKFDLGVIILLQILALCYGVHSIEQGRPAWIAYNVDRFELVRKNEIITDHIDKHFPNSSIYLGLNRNGWVWSLLKMQMFGVMIYSQKH